ncbi:hypothetical protein EV385_2984 [Krasilnikovia cinnamomea]|uniref:Uncharacterized protein n=1 Tax=Krasilnikovia cinnamomea TaxID=349313 RepID=A0A4Q7ZLE6_9ACTN|nr:hypothetical protein EV385_2984 [Krasilnikovia cinnamomea]
MGRPASVGVGLVSVTVLLLLSALVARTHGVWGVTALLLLSGALVAAYAARRRAREQLAWLAAVVTAHRLLLTIRRSPRTLSGDGPPSKSRTARGGPPHDRHRRRCAPHIRGAAEPRG